MSEKCVHNDIHINSESVKISPNTPNKETNAAMLEAEKLASDPAAKSYTDTAKLFADLGDDPESYSMLETERLILRSFCDGDAEDVFDYLKESMVNCFACMKVHSLEEAQKAVMERAEDPEYTFAIILKDTGKVIGEIDAHPESSQPDGAESYVKDTFSPCWMLNPDFHGKGYAYEAAKAFFDYLFYQKGARRIYAYTEDYNLPSQHLCEKLGMRREGLFREFVSFVNDADGNPIYENTYQYAILKKEWDAKRK